MTSMVRVSVMVLAAACVACHLLGIPDEQIHQLLIQLVAHERIMPT